ncbi:hypothetical protein ACLMJK_009580 [Lecanora helva]
MENHATQGVAHALNYVTDYRSSLELPYGIIEKQDDESQNWGTCSIDWLSVIISAFIHTCVAVSPAARVSTLDSPSTKILKKQLISRSIGTPSHAHTLRRSPTVHKYKLTFSTLFFENPETNMHLLPPTTLVAVLASLNTFPLITLSIPTKLTPRNNGVARVVNNCPFTVYLDGYGQATSGDGYSGEATLPAQGGTYEEAYAAPNDGRSLKAAIVSGSQSKPVLQLEYTNGGDGRISYDVSEVDGNPFGPAGFGLTSSNSGCFSAWCAPPGNNCPGLFTDPTNGIPHLCGMGDSITLTLC